MVRIDGIIQFDPKDTIKAWASPDLTAAIVAGDLLYLDSDGEWVEAGGSGDTGVEADAVALTGCTVAEASSANQDAYIVGVTHGRVSGDFTSLTKGTAFMTSEETAGSIAQGETTNTKTIGIVVSDKLAQLHIPVG